MNAESAVVGMLIREAPLIDEVLGTGLKTEHFADGTLRMVFDKILALDSQQSSWDLPTVAAVVESAYVVKLVELVENAPVTQSASYFARMVRSAARRRRGVEVFADAARRLATHELGDDDTLAWAEIDAAVTQLALDDSGGNLATPSPADQAIAAFEYYQKTKELREGGKLPGFTTGFASLDARTGGFRAPGLYLVAGRPGMGKTALAGHFALSAADAGARVCFMTLEMGWRQILFRLMASRALVPTKGIIDGDLSEEQEDRLVHALREYGGGMLTINEDAGYNIDTLEAEARRLKRMKKLDMLVVDYAQLMEGSTYKRYAVRAQEVGDISKRLKKIAKQLDIVVLSCAQINRDATKAQDKRPTMAQLKDSGSLEQDADCVLLFHRPSYYKLDGDDEIILEKNRDGASDTIYVYSDLKINKFREIE